MMDIRFQNKIVFLTGASRGIGKEIRRVMEENGAQVIAPTRVEMDLADPNSIEAYLKKNKELLPDIFIHCAGINELAGIEEITQEILTKVFQVNYYAPVRLLKQFTSGMESKNWGRIVFISSLYAIVSRERRIAYSSSKNALTGLTKTMALELASYNILVNAVAPGYVMTEMTMNNLSETEIKAIENKIPTGRFQTGEEIADVVAFLCSDFNQSITGQLLAVDGGFLCR